MSAKSAVDMSKFADLGRNVKMLKEGNIVFLAIDTTAAGSPSASGKTLVKATTNGNVAVPGTNAKIGLNYYEPRA